ncbi:MAG: response regulator [Treponema sp.]|nr:response regulator [Treponema sp.]
MKTVMVVDDSKIMRNIVKNYFEQIKVPVHFLEAGDGREAIQLLLNNNVDLVLLDWNMPALSGIDFLKKVRAMDKYSEIPIIMVTSEASKLNVIEAVKEGATAYITKPINEKSFIDKLSKIML